jgi:flagellar protein FlaI
VQDRYSYTGRSSTYSDIAEKRGWTKDRLESEIATRRQILNAMKTQGMRDYVSVAALFHAYYIDPENVLAHIADLRQVIQ